MTGVAKLFAESVTDNKADGQEIRLPMKSAEIRWNLDELHVPSSDGQKK